jgi:hypothetical protein
MNWLVWSLLSAAFAAATAILAQNRGREDRAGCPSTLMTRGEGPPLDNARRKNSFAAARSCLGDNMNSMVSPAESRARYKYAQLPATLT